MKEHISQILRDIIIPEQNNEVHGHSILNDPPSINDPPNSHLVPLDNRETLVQGL